MSAPKWWKEAVGFQIWPASYKDSDGDGYGDIPGIISTLDYVKSLGVDFIWLSPTYDSPQHDWGYDISNYEDIWPKYGTLRDMEVLIEGCHSRGMKLVLDLVVNHTSDEHAWFQESKRSRTNGKADWYIWRDPKVTDGVRHAPNNWKSNFGGSAWTYVPERDQYYLHICLPQQPDLNWENPVTREAIYESAIRFWLRRGIDGFRVDIVNMYSKDQSFPDAPIKFPETELQPIDPKFYLNGPRMHEWLQEQRRDALDSFGQDIVLIGELPLTATDEILRYTSSHNRELDMVFDFDWLLSGIDPNLEPYEWGPPKLPEVKAAFAKAQGFLNDKALDAWTTVFMENHDCTRSVSKYGDASNPSTWASSAKVLAMMLCTLSGTLFVYQGQEIGMTSLPQGFPLEEMRDGPWIKNLQDAIAKHPGNEEFRQKVMRGFMLAGRDNNRTPVQWDGDTPGAGFTSAPVPWMKVNESYKTINVKSQLGVPGSILEFWKQMIRLRKSPGWKDLFIHGDFELLDPTNENTFTFIKRAGMRSVLVTLNFSGDEQVLFVPDGLDLQSCRVLMSNYDGGHTSGRDNLRAWEGRIHVIE
jgi:oligo-1,6-glucosidase